MVETTLISKRVFRCFLLNYTDFAHEISHIKPSKYNSTFGIKISICLKKAGGWGYGSEQAPLKPSKGLNTQQSSCRLKGHWPETLDTWMLHDKCHWTLTSQSWYCFSNQLNMWLASYARYSIPSCVTCSSTCCTPNRITLLPICNPTNQNEPDLLITIPRLVL